MATTATTADASLPVDPKTALVTQVLALGLPQDKITSILLDDRPEWAFRNMYTYAGADAVIKASLNARPALYNFHAITNMFLIFCPIIVASFFIASYVFRFMPGLKRRYMAIRKEERIIAIFHVIFTISFAIKIVPQSIWTIHLLWGPSFAQQFNNNYKRLWACAITNALMYLAEGCVRSVVRINPFLVAHHILYFTLFFIPVVRDSVWGQKLILLLDVFIVWCELPLYLALLTHRFVISTRKVKVMTWLCCIWSSLLRIAELVILICYFKGTRRRMADWGETQMWGWFLALCIPGGALVVLYSLGIFWWFLVKRDRNPEKYGRNRFNLPPSKNSFADNDGVRHGVNDIHSVPPKLDP